MDLEDAYDKFAIYDKVDNGSEGEEQQPELDPNVNYNEVTDEEPSEEESSEDSSDDFSRMNHQKQNRAKIMGNHSIFLNLPLVIFQGF